MGCICRGFFVLITTTHIWWYFTPVVVVNISHVFADDVNSTVMGVMVSLVGRDSDRDREERLEGTETD